MRAVNIGDVVIANYTSFDGEIKKGIFIVVYHERADVRGSYNFTGVKVSTREYCYQIPLMKQHASFLENEVSYANCNQLIRLREIDVVGFLGVINTYYLKGIMHQITSYHNRMMQQLKVEMERKSMIAGGNYY